MDFIGLFLVLWVGFERAKERFFCNYTLAVTRSIINVPHTEREDNGGRFFVSVRERVDPWGVPLTTTLKHNTDTPDT